MHTTSNVQAPSLTLTSGVTIPDSKMAREVTELVRDIESPLLFNHEGVLESAPLLCPNPLVAEEFALGTGGEVGPYASERRARPHL